MVHAADNDWLIGVAFGEIDLRGRIGRCAVADRCAAYDGFEFVFRQPRAAFLQVVRRGGLAVLVLGLSLFAMLTSLSWSQKVLRAQSLSS